jgi:transcription initiation factor TFIIIB Brf1 subunit/transcription initiation factor TFIIB
MADKKPLSFQEFLQLRKDADTLVRELVEKDLSLQGKKPSNLRAAAIWYLARARGFNLTQHPLYSIYGSRQLTLIEQRKLIEKAAAKSQRG